MLLPEVFKSVLPDVFLRVEAFLVAGGILSYRLLYRRQWRRSQTSIRLLAANGGGLRRPSDFWPPMEAVSDVHPTSGRQWRRSQTSALTSRRQWRRSQTSALTSRHQWRRSQTSTRLLAANKATQEPLLLSRRHRRQFLTSALTSGRQRRRSQTSVRLLAANGGALRRLTCRLALDASRQSLYLLPWSSLEAAAGLLAALLWMQGGFRPFCRCRPEDEDSLAAALLWMRGGCRTTCDLEAAVVIPAALPWMQGGRHPLCSLGVH